MKKPQLAKMAGGVVSATTIAVITLEEEVWVAPDGPQGDTMVAVLSMINYEGDHIRYFPPWGGPEGEVRELHHTRIKSIRFVNNPFAITYVLNASLQACSS